ncbi:MAG TPA: carbohydrate ABC transporter permease [Candidatus Dormibacteraeota bacterium]|nr:carbohydrate ABC transporter permease [Candidatus Dormibacteraeota bacterium]
MSHATRRPRARVFAYALLAGYTLLVFVPFAWSLVTSFKTLPDSLTLSFLPHPFTTYGYQKAFAQLQPGLPALLLNSTLIAASVTVTNVVLGALAGYAFARLRFPGREAIFLAVLGTLMIPDQLRLVPVYQILAGLHLITPGPANYATVVSILAVRALSVFLMRQYFLTIPYDLEEAARLDGAGTFGTFWRVMLPTARPALAAVAILSFQDAWNNFFWPLVLLQAPAHWTLPLGLAQFRFLYSTDWPPLMAVTVIATVPIVVLYVFFQRYFVRGLTSGAVRA